MNQTGFVTTEDGVRLYFEQTGDGRPPALIPNGIYLKADFAPLAEGRRLVFYDGRNRGRSDSGDDDLGKVTGLTVDLALLAVELLPQNGRGIFNGQIFNIDIVFILEEFTHQRVLWPHVGAAADAANHIELIEFSIKC